MEYMILIYGDEKAWAAMNEQQLKEAYAGYVTYTKDLTDAGVIRGGSELHPISTASTVRVRGGKVTATDGPFAETKEQLGGYYIIEAANLDGAISWAAKCPGAKMGVCEVRPLKAM